MMWENITAFDWGFIAIVPLVLIYLGWVVWTDHRDRKRREKAEEQEVMTAITRWLLNPCEETAAEADRLLAEMKEKGWKNGP